MFGTLAVVDWIALILATILLTAAVAAVVVAVIAARHRNRNVPLAHASVEPTRVDDPGDAATTLDLRDLGTETPPQSPPVRTDVVEPTSAASSAAERARKLRDRPEPDATPPSRTGAPKHAATASNPATPPMGSRRTGFELRRPGFFEDPVGRHEQRYWDGKRWTEHVKENGRRFVDPL